MLRRRHKKSRGGCLQCKARHVKCDEHHPVCRLCELSDRGHECSFAAAAAAAAPQQLSPGSSTVTSSPSPTGRMRTPLHLSLSTETGSEIGGGPSSASSAEHISLQGGGQSALRGQVRSLEEAVNLDHMELMVHLTKSADIFGYLGMDSDAWSSVALPLALKHPYLLHELLAFSAYHLALLHPHRSDAYAHQSVLLQTRAISLFNTTWTDTKADSDAYMAALLFSSALGHHLLAETLAKRENGALSAFIGHYAKSLHLYSRGVRAVAHQAWSMLLQSELEPILATSKKIYTQEPRGDHCARLKELIEGSRNLEESEKAACRLAIRYLQVGFDTVNAESKYNQMIMLWGILSPSEYTDLLEANRFEALVILSYYALLLHHGREMWQVGDAGSYIMGMLVDSLGPECEWIDYPVRAIGTLEGHLSPNLSRA